MGECGFRARLRTGPILVAPGVFDALSALLAERAGFEALFLSGSALAYTRLGSPDIGLITATELADATARIADRVALPIIVDADTGFGGVAHVARATRLLERAGAAAIQIEDQQVVKPANALASRPLVAVEEMVGRIKAAQDARSSDAFLISARTDAVVTTGFDDAMRRAEAYVRAGADLLFVEAMSELGQLDRLAAAFGRELPLIVNLFEGGRAPVSSTAELEARGFRVTLFSGAIVTTMAKAAEDMLGVLRAEGSTAGMRERMFDAAALNARIGTPDVLARFAELK